MASRQGYGEDHASGWGFGLHHVLLAIPAGSEDASRTFYLGVLGMAEVAKPPALAARGGRGPGSRYRRAGSVRRDGRATGRVRADSLELHLGVEADFRPAGKAHPGIRVPDLDGLAAHLGARAVTIAWDTSLFPGHRRFHADDPMGNRLEFTARDPGIPTW